MSIAPGWESKEQLWEMIYGLRNEIEALKEKIKAMKENIGKMNDEHGSFSGWIRKEDAQAEIEAGRKDSDRAITAMIGMTNERDSIVLWATLLPLWETSMEPDRQKLGEDIARQFERLYMMIDSVGMLQKIEDEELMNVRAHIGLGAMMLADLVRE